MIPNHAEPSRYGEHISTGLIDGTVNTVVDKRFAKRPQIRWSRQGAHLVLQTRTRTFDGTLRAKFKHWHTDVKQPKKSPRAPICPKHCGTLHNEPPDKKREPTCFPFLWLR